MKSETTLKSSFKLISVKYFLFFTYKNAYQNIPNYAIIKN